MKLFSSKQTKEDSKSSSVDERELNAKDKELKAKERLPHVPKWAYRVIVILMITVVGLGIWMNRDNLSPQNIGDWVQTQFLGMGVGEGYPLNLNGDEVAAQNFCVSDGRLLLTGNTTILSLNSSAKQIFSRKHGFSNPVMLAKGQKVLVYNQGGKGYRIENQIKTLVSDTASQNIVTAALASNGAYALVLEDSGYCGKLTAYTKDNKEAYNYWFSDAYPTAIALNEEGNRAVVTAVTVNNGVLQSSFYLLDFNSTDPVTPVGTYPNTVFTKVSYQNGSITAVGDTRTVVMSDKGKEIANYDYQGAKLVCAALDQNRAALCLSSFENASAVKLVTLSNQGTQESSIDVDSRVTAVSLYGDTMAALLDGQVRAYSVSRGTQTGSCDIKSDMRAIALSSEKQVYLLGVSEVNCATFQASTASSGVS